MAVKKYLVIAFIAIYHSASGALIGLFIKSMKVLFQPHLSVDKTRKIINTFSPKFDKKIGKEPNDE